MADDKKPVHTIVLDAGPLISNTPSISTLLQKSEEIYSTPSVISEIKDVSARARLELLVMPLIKLRTPSIDSMKFVTEFARKTGDLPVLSKTDLEVIALAYELECERNGGDWRLRKTPGQKTVNGPPPTKDLNLNSSGGHKDGELAVDQSSTTNTQTQSSACHSGEDGPPEDYTSIAAQSINNLSVNDTSSDMTDITAQGLPGKATSSENTSGSSHLSKLPDSVPGKIGILDEAADQEPHSETMTSMAHDIPEAQNIDLSRESDTDSDGGEWITPSSINRHKLSNTSPSGSEAKQPRTLQVATLTADHTLQNTLLLINLNLLSSSLSRITHIKTHILRCHACFATMKQMDKQFCPRCGQPALTRVTTSTNANGTTTLHLKKNMQWNTRGDRYSIPKPVAGTSNGKMREKGGGKSGWGKDLILAEDQKEYVRALQDKERERRKGERDLLDQDFMPGFMGGDRSHGPGERIRIGAGKGVNSRKRH